jgi:hypothetical protein
MTSEIIATTVALLGFVLSFLFVTIIVISALPVQ